MPGARAAVVHVHDVNTLELVRHVEESWLGGGGGEEAGDQRGVVDPPDQGVVRHQVPRHRVRVLVPQSSNAVRMVSRVTWANLRTEG